MSSKIFLIVAAGISNWYQKLILGIGCLWRPIQKIKDHFFVSTTVISRYKKLRAGATINHFSSSDHMFGLYDVEKNSLQPCDASVADQQHEVWWQHRHDSLPLTEEEE
jgi:hypothetical protein